jgi:serine/threonine protein kinase
MIGKKITVMKKKSNKKVSDTYQIIKQIGSGSFGEVYSAKNKNGRIRAAKVENKEKSPKLINEYNIYNYFYKKGLTVGIPKVYSMIETPDYNMMFMQLLGPSLEDLFKKYNKKLEVPTVLMIAIQIISILEQIHTYNYIHRDIKPSNFLIGLDSEKTQIYILDFGLSKRYRNHETHMPYRSDKSLIGTSRYASTNMHRGSEPSRRDDLESFGHVLVYLLKGSLPWQGLKKKKTDSHIKTIGEVKLSTTLDDLCSGIPDCFKTYLEYCRGLKFEETPNYELINKMFIDYCTQNSITPKLQWA